MVDGRAVALQSLVASWFNGSNRFELGIDMRFKIFTLAILSGSTLALAACQVPPILENAQYWQRKNATSALYLRGPKAQQTLHKDIADCVTEIDELERLGPLRENLPADTKNGKIVDPNSPEGKLRKWDTPKRDGALYAEHFNYTDFEGCMDYKGWERVENLPYDQATKARGEYLETLYGYRYQSKYGENLSTEKSADGYATSSPGTKINN